MFVSLFSLSKSEVPLHFKPYSASYTFTGTWRVPYTNLTNPIYVVTDSGRQYVSKYGGLDEEWISHKSERIYRHRVRSSNTESGITCFSYVEGVNDWEWEPVEFIPQPDDFYYIGDKTVNGRLCHQYRKYIDTTAKPQTFDFFIDAFTLLPVSYQTKSISIYNSHYDIYIVDFDNFVPYAAPGYWNYPSATECNVPVPADSSSTRSKQIRRSLGRRSRSKTANGVDAVDKCTLFTGHSDYKPPRTWSWRKDNKTVVVGPPRDQCACGSCWAYGAAGALEGQLALKKGEFHELSINQIMDCTWDTDNKACDGGEAGPAFTSLMDNKLKVTYEKDYPYIAVGGVCDKNIPDDRVALKVVGCYKIDRTTKALKEAVHTLGPVSIGINVPHSMSWYTSGVYNDPACTGVHSDLVHEVLLTGWSIIDGQEVWEVRNSWSTYWGDNGYIYIQSEDQEHNCGVTTEATIPVIDLY